VLEIAATQGETIDVGLEFVLLAALGAACLIGGMVTALKSRWGWFILGLVTAGLIWPLTALLIAQPDSPWARSFYGPPKLARARRRKQ
jgi:bacteriorhodopsin